MKKLNPPKLNKKPKMDRRVKKVINMLKAKKIVPAFSSDNTTGNDPPIELNICDCANCRANRTLHPVIPLECKKNPFHYRINKGKPDIEYGITDEGRLKVWCNCKKKPKGSVICEDCATYFTDKLKKAVDGDYDAHLEILEQHIDKAKSRIAQLDERTIGDIRFTI